MALDAEFEELFQRPQPPPGAPDAVGGPPVDQEFERFLERHRAPTQPRQSPTEYNVVGLVNWVRENPWQAADWMIQAGVAGLGAWATSGAGPLAMMAGGAGGNLAGDIMGSIASGRPQPTGVEGAMDALIGGVAPIAGPLARGGTAGLGRTFTNTRGPAGRDIIRDQLDDMSDLAIAQSETVDLINGRLPGVVARDLQQTITDRATTTAINASGPTRVAGPAGVMFDIVSGSFDPTRMAGWLLAGTTLPHAQEQMVRRMLTNPNTLQAMQTTVRGLLGQEVSEDVLRSRILSTVLGSVIGRDTTETLGGTAHERRNPFLGVTTVETPRGPRGRDEITGRFTSLTGNE